MNRKIEINGTQIGLTNHVYIIAEMSANHLQDRQRAKEIIKAAKESGADAVKIQTYRPDTLTLDCSRDEFFATPKSPWEGMRLFDLYQSAYMPWEWHEELFSYAEQIKITCFSTPFDLSAVDFLRKYQPPAYKIASYEINDIPLIRKVAREGKPVILSTGIAELSDIALAVETCRKEQNDQLILLKCVSEYPTPFEEIHLQTMKNMEETFHCLIGLSDHSLGEHAAIAAAALGAKVIEKHFTLCRSDGGLDASFSMEPAEFEKLVNHVRDIEKAVGNVTYSLTERQKKSKERSRSLYIVRDIKKGEEFTEQNIRSIRPGYGLPPKYYDKILGKYANRDLSKGTALKWDYIEKYKGE